jgi:hypothetical protein
LFLEVLDLFAQGNEVLVGFFLVASLEAVFDSFKKQIIKVDIEPSLKESKTASRLATRKNPIKTSSSCAKRSRTSRNK